MVRCSQRDALRQHLQALGIETGIHYPIPIHLQEAYQDLNHHQGDFPVAERLAQELLSLPMYPELTEEQIAYVCAGIRSFSVAEKAPPLPASIPGSE